MGRFADHRAPFLAGTVASITGQAASTGLILAAWSVLGASQAQTSSAIFVMVLLFGLLSILLSHKFKMPISIVWSTPGAALIASSAALGLPFSSAVGAFLVSGVLLLLTGLWPALGRLVSSIPKPIASAMLAGVIFSFCIAPFKSISEFAWIILPALAVWLFLYKYATIWASPAAIAIIFTLTAIAFGIQVSGSSFVPTIEIVTPTFDLAAIFGIGIPLYFVTMASQNIPGIAIMKSLGFDVPFRYVMTSTGIASIISSLFGGFNINLAAITAALNANEHAHADKSRRWLASVYGGFFYIVIAYFSAVTVEFVLQAPRELILAAAGIALFGTMVSAISGAASEEQLRLPAILTFLLTASGISIFGIGSAFWALIAGLLVWAWLSNSVLGKKLSKN